MNCHICMKPYYRGKFLKIYKTPYWISCIPKSWGKYTISILGYKMVNKNINLTGEIAQRLKQLPHKYEGPRSDPQNPHKHRVVVAAQPVIPTPRKRRHRIPGVAGQPNSSRPWAPGSNEQHGRAIEQGFSLYIHTHIHVHTYACPHINTYPHKHEEECL